MYIHLANVGGLCTFARRILAAPPQCGTILWIPVLTVGNPWYRVSCLIHGYLNIFDTFGECAVALEKVPFACCVNRVYQALYTINDQSSYGHGYWIVSDFLVGQLWRVSDGVAEFWCIPNGLARSRGFSGSGLISPPRLQN